MSRSNKKNHPLVRLGAVLLGCLAICQVGRAAQETPAEASAAVPADAVPEQTNGPRHIVLMLPPTFSEYQNAVSGLEIVPDWTNAARKNLGDAALETLQTAGSLQLQELPALTAEESVILHDHIAVAQLIVAAGLQYKDSEWHKHRESFDRSFGDGLRFLHERTGADYALLIDGTQVRQSGGRIAMRLLGSLAAAAGGVLIIPTGGGGETVNVCMLDLNHGSVAWFNSSRAIEVFGSSGTDLRNAEAAKTAMKKLLASYPAIPALSN